MIEILLQYVIGRKADCICRIKDPPVPRSHTGSSKRNQKSENQISVKRHSFTLNSEGQITFDRFRIKV